MWPKFYNILLDQAFSLIDNEVGRIRLPCSSMKSYNAIVVQNDEK